MAILGFLEKKLPSSDLLFAGRVVGNRGSFLSKKTCSLRSFRGWDERTEGVLCCLVGRFCLFVKCTGNVGSCRGIFGPAKREKAPLVWKYRFSVFSDVEKECRCLQFVEKSCRCFILFFSWSGSKLFILFCCRSNVKILVFHRDFYYF